ncbi:MAG: NAD(P)/FAD-dependent oxidoreductase [Rhodoplanes sp.]
MALLSRRAPDEKRPRVVVVGAGFGGLAAVQELGGRAADVTWIDQRNHHLFQPLLYQVATAALAAPDIAVPLRGVARGYRNVDVLMDTVVDVDRDRREVVTRHRRVPFDILIIATGAETSYFGNDRWRDIAWGLKSLEEATALRRRILLALEEADRDDDEERKRRLMTFVLIGAGPTGVEMAGAIAEITKGVLAEDYKHLDPRQVSIILIEAMDQVLPGFPKDLAGYAHNRLERMGVIVRVGAKVEEITEEACIAGGERFVAANVIWSAGVKATPAAQWLKVEADRKGRVQVGKDLLVPGTNNIYVIGDASVASAPDGQPFPGLAAVAKQQGKFVARRILAEVTGKAPAAEFRYVDWGTMATLGYTYAVGDLQGVHLKGRIAWLVWATVHVWYLIGFRNRLRVLLNWFWEYVTYRPGTRLITGGMETPPRAEAALEHARESAP